MSSSWPKPNQVFVAETDEITVLNSSRVEKKEDFVGQSSPTEQNINKELVESLQEVYSPVFKMMKFFGAYFGDTTFDRLVHAQTPGLGSKTSYVSPFYCGVMVAGLWLNFVLPLVSVFFGEPIYLLLMFDMWCLWVAVNGIVCLIVLPLTDKRKSRFERFITNAGLLTSDSINLENLKSKKRKYLMMISFFMLSGVVGAVVCDFVLGINFGSFQPWCEWFSFRVTSPLFLAIGCGFWFLPIVFLCLTCLVLEAVFDDLHRLFSSPSTMDISALRMQHSKLCEFVELADGVLSPLIFNFVGLCIPFTCFCLYQLAHLPEEDTIVFLFLDLYWIVASSVVLAVVMIFGSRVNEKVKKKKKNI